MSVMFGMRNVLIQRVAVLALVGLGLSACAELVKDEQPAWVNPQAAGDAPPPVPTLVEPIPIVEGLVTASAGGGCSVARVASGGDLPLTADEARAAYACLSPQTAATYAGSSHLLTRNHVQWSRVDTAPFQIAALDDRYAAVFANGRALSQNPDNLHKDRGYDIGSVLAVSSFGVDAQGGVQAGPLVFVEKMSPGFAPIQGNWRYTIVDPAGVVDAVTNGKNADSISMCVDCTHKDADRLYLSLLHNGQVPL